MVTLFAFVVYLLTLAPSITWHNDGVDGGDLIAAVASGGVPHPTGYPTYLLLGDLFIRVPVGDLAYRLNLMSAAAAAVAAGLICLVMRVSLRGAGCDTGGVAVFAAGIAALIFAFSSILWSQAVVAEVYALNAFFAALVCFLALRARAAPLCTSVFPLRREGRRAGARHRWLWILAAGVFGLGLGNHLSLALLTPLGIAIFWSSWQQMRRGTDETDEGRGTGAGAGPAPTNVWLLIVMGLACLSGLAVYALLPLRAAQRPPINWGGADTWEGFIWLVSGRAYAPLVGGLPLAQLPGRLLAAVSLLCRQAAWWGVPVALLGLGSQWGRDRALAVGSLLSFGAIVAYAVGYNTTDSYVYLIPAAMLMAVWMAWGLCDGLARLRRWSAGLPASRQLLAQLACGGGMVALTALPLAVNVAVVDARGDREAYDYGVVALSGVRQGAIILTDGDRDTFALWYFRYAEGRRPDVAVVNGHLLAYEWYRASLQHWHPAVEILPGVDDPQQAVQLLIQANLSRHPIYMTSVDWALPPGYHLVDEGMLHRVESPL